MFASRTYESSLHLYQNVEEREQVSLAWIGTPMHERDPPGPLSARPHYATTSAVEYFAELAEAFFAFNGQYPWNRSELWKLDPDD